MGAAGGETNKLHAASNTPQDGTRSGMDACDGGLTGVGGWCCGGDRCQVHLRNVKVITVVRVLGSAHTAEVRGECL